MDGASAAHALAAGVIGFAVARTVLGIGEGAVFPGCVKMSTDSLPTEKVSRGIGIGYSGAAFGSLIAPLAVVPFAARYGWRSAFWITGALGIGWLLMWWRVARSLPKRVRVSHKVAVVNPLDRRFWLIVTTYGMGAVALGVVAYMSPLYLSRALRLSQKEIGHLVWIPTIGWQLGYYFWGWVSDRLVPDQTRPVKGSPVALLARASQRLCHHVSLLAGGAGAVPVGDVRGRRLHRDGPARRGESVYKGRSGAGGRDWRRRMVGGSGGRPAALRG